MAELPEELWRKILEMGVKPSNKHNNNGFTFKELCCTAITCKRLHRLSNEPSLWSSLLSSDFPLRLTTNNNNNNSSSSISPKSLYKSWYEKDKAKRVAAHKRAVLRIESRITENSRRIEELRTRLVEESNRMKAVAFELSNLRRVRQASVALNVWQPEVVRGRQKEIVEQCAVPVDLRINALEMELKLCKQHLIVHEKNYRDEKRRLEVAKEQLSLMRYHPLQNVSVDERRVGEPSAKRKKLKTHISADDEHNWKL
ncbi:F-box protein SKIP24-like isoform X2 [Chenopodium quinoa]|uniref:F-box protein SKIP24-like isoform X2 n=1 Tax=Chenopodium quinoa TaxID=63459 RepID=UPI000B77CC5F|nr:F-box protein SKIP24-like isoform X2 [Chenopodium quinoa]